MNPQPVTGDSHTAAKPAAAEKPWRSAPIDDQIEAVKRVQDRQRKYHAKIMAVGTNANPTFYRLEDWRLSSAIRSLEALRDDVSRSAG